MPGWGDVADEILEDSLKPELYTVFLVRSVSDTELQLVRKVALRSEILSYLSLQWTSTTLLYAYYMVSPLTFQQIPCETLEQGWQSPDESGALVTLERDYILSSVHEVGVVMSDGEVSLGSVVPSPFELSRVPCVWIESVLTYTAPGRVGSLSDASGLLPPGSGWSGPADSWAGGGVVSQGGLLFGDTYTLYSGVFKTLASPYAHYYKTCSAPFVLLPYWQQAQGVRSLWRYGLEACQDGDNWQVVHESPIDTPFETFTHSPGVPYRVNYTSHSVAISQGTAYWWDVPCMWVALDRQYYGDVAPGGVESSVDSGLVVNVVPSVINMITGSGVDWVSTQAGLSPLIINGDPLIFKGFPVKIR